MTPVLAGMLTSGLTFAGASLVLAALHASRSLTLVVPLVLVSGLLVVLGVGLTPWSGYYVVRGLQSASWPTVPGTVTQSYTKVVRTQSGRHSHSRRETVVSYRYAVQGAREDGTWLAFSSDDGYPGWSFGSDESRANAIVADHPQGSTVTVTYDPGDPSVAVLTPGLRTTETVRLGVATAALAVGSLSLLLALRDPRLRILRAG